MRIALAWIAGITLSCVGCATEVPSLIEAPMKNRPLVMGRVVAVITGESSRMYGPKVRFFEVGKEGTHERFTVDIQSDDGQFTIALPPGDYRLNRVQISEGPFMSMAEMNASFSVGQDPLTYVGTWRFGVDSPKYGRMVALSIVMDADDRSRAESFLVQEYPAFEGVPVTSVLPDPPTMEARLYEVMPYPRYPSYFRRHNW
jgi:hypothetical protein